VTDLSVVVPIYNEAGVIETLVGHIERELVPRFERLEVIMVDDASTDDTPKILERLARNRPWLHVHRSAANAGHGPSVLRGLRLARADWIFQIDSDGQFLVGEFQLLWAARNDCDLALGVRAQRRDPLHRRLLSRVVRLATSLLAGRRVRDVNTPFRLLRRAAWEDIGAFVRHDALAPNILLTLGASVRGWRIAELPVTHLPRERGTSTLRALRLVRFSLRGLCQLVAFRYRLARAPAAVRIVVGDSR
jgi:dolichol-phosphate mannosyltransferase